MNDVQSGEWFSRRVPPPETRLRCEECGVLSEGRAAGWRGHPCDGWAGITLLVFSCPDCSERP